MQKTPYKNPKKILAQIWRTLKRKISATCCFTTRYADFGGERGSATTLANFLYNKQLSKHSKAVYRMCSHFLTLK